MAGRRSNVAASISTPVESSRPVVGHLTMTTLAWPMSSPSHNPPELARLVDCSLPGLGTKRTPKRVGGGRYPTAPYNQARLLGGLSVSEQESRSQLRDDYFAANNFHADLARRRSHSPMLSERRSPRCPERRGHRAKAVQSRGLLVLRCSAAPSSGRDDSPQGEI